MTSPRTSHSLSRRNVVQQSARPSLRQRSVPRSTSSAAPLRATVAGLTPEEEALALGESSVGSVSSTRKSRLVTKLTERDEADRKEREREQRKVLLKEKRNTSQLLVQVRHAAEQSKSKVKRGEVEVGKIQTELGRLERWRQGQEDRIQQLMKQLIEEQDAIEQEFQAKFSEADELLSTLTEEQSHLEEEQSVKEDEVSRVEEHLQRVDATLGQLDDGLGATWHGAWKPAPEDGLDRLLDDSGANLSSVGISRLQPIIGPDLFTCSTPTGSVHSTGQSSGAAEKLRQMSQQSRSSPRPRSNPTKSAASTTASSSHLRVLPSPPSSSASGPAASSDYKPLKNANVSGYAPNASPSGSSTGLNWSM